MELKEPSWWSDPKQVAVCMAFDAFRICIGGTPKNFTASQVAQWLANMSTKK
jgi:hypothetical protein